MTDAAARFARMSGITPEALEAGERRRQAKDADAAAEAAGRVRGPLGTTMDGPPAAPSMRTAAHYA